jgi:hypothetical protein
VAMRNALPAVRKWLETPVGETSDARPRAVAAKPAPMPAD